MYPTDQIQTIECGLNDTIRFKRKEALLRFNSLTASNMNFKKIFMTQVIFEKKIVTKLLVPWNHYFYQVSFSNHENKL